MESDHEEDDNFSDPEESEHEDVESDDGAGIDPDGSDDEASQPPAPTSSTSWLPQSPTEMSSVSARSKLRRDKSTPDRYTDVPDRGHYGKLLTGQKTVRTEACGNRLVSLPLMAAHMSPHLCCPLCKRTNTMLLHQEDEGELGLASELRFRCGKCNRLSITLPTSLTCGLIGKKNSAIQEMNLGRGTISYHFWYNFLSLVFCCILFCILLYFGKFRKYAVFCRILKV